MQATEVAERHQLTLPTAYHLLNSLLSEGMLARDMQRRYYLGPRVAVLAEAFGKGDSLVDYYDFSLRELANLTRETVYLTAWRGTDIPVLSTREGAHAVRVAALSRGYSENIHARASGKALLAFASESVIEAKLSSISLTARTSHTITELGKLRNELEAIRSTGIAYDREEFNEGVRGIAAPIVVDGFVIGALAISAPAARFLKEEKRLTEVLLKVAQEASELSLSWNDRQSNPEGQDK
jgi:DNA-binding IclR family transcriptional regulator